MNLAFISISLLKARRYFPDILPRQTIRSFDGRTYDLSKPMRFKLLCFVDRDKAMLESISALVRFCISINIVDLDFLVFTDMPGASCAEIPENKNLFIANKEESYVLQHNPTFDFYLYNGQGRMIRGGPSSLEPYRLIWWVIEAEDIRLPPWPLTKLLPPINESVYANRSMSFLKAFIDPSDSSLFVFIFLDDFCGTCNSGRVVDEIDSLVMTNERPKFFLVLSPDYSEDDLVNIKKNEDMQFELIRWPKEVADYSEEYLHSNYMSTVNGLAFVVDKNGSLCFVTDLFDELDRFSHNRLEVLKTYVASIRVNQ